MTTLETILILFPPVFSVICIGSYFLYALIQVATEVDIFQHDLRSSKRTCKLCGSTQVLDGRSWWEEKYPSGNNPNCPCHKFAEL